MNQKIVIGTRGSDLALLQARHIQAQLSERGFESKISIITTKGDAIQNLSFDKIEGKGFFTKELEEALLNREIDLAVHSHKDLETSMPEELAIAAVSERQGTGDLLLIRREKVEAGKKFSLQENPVIGTSSSRRKALMKHFRSDAAMKDIRGNVPTRLQKLRNGDFDAILLAAAGVERLNLDLSDLYVVKLAPEEFVPAPAQGVLAVQCRSNDADLIKILSLIDNGSSRELVEIERKVLSLLEGGCQLPLGVYALKDNAGFEVHVAYATSWEKPLRNLTFVADSSRGLAELIVEELRKQPFA
ncbi:MAG: hydroxymethylbilane synthase [Crocinitomicaceae bacterium]|nr:hydroxymethylbilane synthase [Crocinitomicaceae bacterium]